MMVLLGPNVTGVLDVQLQCHELQGMRCSAGR